jgi:hypothetical protein
MVYLAFVSAFSGVSLIRPFVEPISVSRATLVIAPTRMSLDALTLLSTNPAALESVAASFRSLNMPAPLVQYGHPAMMAIMTVAMGGSGAALGWAGRLNDDKRAGLKQKDTHANIMLAFTMLAALGGLGGTLSTAMQGFDVWESRHAQSAGLILGLLTINATLAYTGFGKSPKAKIAGRKFHAIFGAVAMGAFVGHAYLGTLLFG